MDQARTDIMSQLRTLKTGGEVYWTPVPGGPQLAMGNGAPTCTANRNSIYQRADGTTSATRFYMNTDGGTTWANGTLSA